MIDTVDELRAWLRIRGLAPLTGEGSVVDAIAGERVRGSWWAHAHGKLIFKLISGLEESDGVLCCKLVAPRARTLTDGRVTFVDRALWPALARVVLDEARRARAITALSKDARALLRDVERKGARTIERAATKAKKELEGAMLVAVDQVHSPTGAHVTRLRSWRHVFPAQLMDEALALELDEARRRLGVDGSR